MKNITKFMENNKKLRIIELIVFVMLIVSSLFLFIFGSCYINQKITSNSYYEEVQMTRNVEYEDYDEDSTKCDVIYESIDKEKSLIITYSYDEYLLLPDDNQIMAYGYKINDKIIYFDHMNPLESEIKSSFKAYLADNSNLFSIATSLLILGISSFVVIFFASLFSTYEKLWFISIMALATIISIIIPEESANGVSGIIIMILYLLDTFLNILCELLISKQSKWNFIVSIGVEIAEILICVVLMYRFATMVTTLFFWLPIDILSFINWSKHKDEKQEELTIVRRLKGWQEVLILSGIVIWTIAVGYLLSGINISSDLFHGNEKLKTAVIYIDACASAVGICNGLFIFFRIREQWIAWYICAFLEAVINILSGQYVLLVLKLGYFTNTTYGYIKWTKYIKEKENNKITMKATN